MKAIVQDKYGSTDVLRLEEIETPEPGDDDVLVRVHAAGLDRGVWHMMTGVPYIMRVMGLGFRGPKARVRGMDVAGRVEAVGKNVSQFRVGDDVYGITGGSFAEYVCAAEKQLSPKPTKLTYEQAAAVPTSAVTALIGLRDKGNVSGGEKVLIVGASGGVGTFAVQIAKALGAEATGVCSAAKADMVRSIGADHVIDYRREDFTRSERRYDVILDIAGNRSLTQLRRALTPKGTLVIVGGEHGDRWTGGMLRPLRAMVWSPLLGQKMLFFIAMGSKEHMQYLTELVETGKVAPVIDRTFPLAQAAEAIRYMEEGKAMGKVVITV